MTSRELYTIEMGGERGSGKSILAAQHDDDDENNHSKTYSSGMQNLSSYQKEIY